tara:strand:- start:129 stop:917 length:789 start_codon:yes stop_codon:yes gene_type:complete
MIIDINTDKTLEEFNNLSIKKSKSVIAYQNIYNLYKPVNNFPSFKDYRTGPYVFDKIKLNWIIIYSKESKELMAHGILGKIIWDESIEDLPKDGWTGTTIRAYENELSNKKTNTFVGLFVHVIKKFREKKLSGVIVEEMKKLAKKDNKSLIIPLRPPLRYEQNYCAMDFKDFCNLKRDDGLPKDPWLRLHAKLNAKNLKISNTSHQRSMSISSFYNLFGDKKISKTGYYKFKIFGNWHNVYADLNLNIIVMNEGCQWVQHRM